MNWQIKRWQRWHADRPARRKLVLFLRARSLLAAPFSHQWGAKFSIAAFFTVFLTLMLNAADRRELDLDRRFNGTVRPFVETYCITCHGKEKSKGDLDLSPYSTVDSVAGVYVR